ncbi:MULTISPECIES: hypothetical protein [unclassified Lentimonas]|uniref:hypothetical protein n=1 Tax=unclassified Lentimonas TaxID=2630993 RepID=UPI00138A6CB3|nr:MULTISPECIES: hypothetical protein [unclassified Lentimonas]
MIIAIGPQIIRISGDGKYTILVSDTHWHSQIHSIVAAPDGYIYFSMDHFVGRFPIRKTLGDYELLQLADQASQ